VAAESTYFVKSNFNAFAPPTPVNLITFNFFMDLQTLQETITPLPKTTRSYQYKSKTGRPQKGLADLDLPPDWKAEVLRLFAEGASREEIYLHFFRINAHYFDNLLKRDEEFLQLIKKGEQLSFGWWKEMGRKSLGKQFFHDALWFMNMKNRFGWKDRQEIDHNVKENLYVEYEGKSIDDIRRESVALAQEITKTQRGITISSAN